MALYGDMSQRVRWELKVFAPTIEVYSIDEAFLDLEDASVAIDLSDLPRSSGSGEAVRRLREEEQLVRDGKLLTGLQENDPLRLYLEEVAGMPAFGDALLLAEDASFSITNLLKDAGFFNNYC